MIDVNGTKKRAFDFGVQCGQAGMPGNIVPTAYIHPPEVQEAYLEGLQRGKEAMKDPEQWLKAFHTEKAIKGQAMLVECESSKILVVAPNLSGLANFHRRHLDEHFQFDPANTNPVKILTAAW